MSLFDRPPPLPGAPAPLPARSATPPLPSPVDDKEDGELEDGELEEGEIEDNVKDMTSDSDYDDADGDMVLDAPSVSSLPLRPSAPVVFEMPLKRPLSPPPPSSKSHSSRSDSKKQRASKTGPQSKKRRGDAAQPGRDERIEKREPVKREPIACKFYLEGKCRRGDDCEFSHNVERPKKTELCKFYLGHACFRGDACLFSHDTKSVPCFFLQTRNRCAQGDQCRFSHSFPPDAPLSRPPLRDAPHKKDAEEIDAPQPQPPSPSPSPPPTKPVDHVAAFEFTMPASDVSWAADGGEGDSPVYRPPPAALAEAMRLNRH